ncbi:MAG: hypothetical protein HY651_06770 [Acidobacteria bacterium]|nr:hypothetical protein [Acidobacteriota bacterium]
MSIGFQWRGRWGLAAAGGLLATLPQMRAVPPPQSAPAPGPGQTARVSLAEIKTTPGASLMMPLSLTPDPKNPLRSLTIEIGFVSKSLVFQKTSRGLAAELANADIQANLTEGPPDEKGLKRATLRVAASLPEPASKEGLPDGLLAYLLFQVSEDAQPLSVKLTPAVISANDLSTPPKKVSNVGADAGVVVIEALDAVYQRLAPELACFFFSH